jgi:uncharacterized membrane protein YkoI
MMESFERWRRPALLLALAGCAFGLPLCVLGKEQADTEEARQHDHDRARGARERGEVMALEEIMPAVHERFPGDLAQIEFERDNGYWIYEFKLIDSGGRLIDVKVNAKTGAVLDVGGD